MVKENRICSVPGCEEKFSGKNLCKYHYMQDWRKRVKNNTVHVPVVDVDVWPFVVKELGISGANSRVVKF